MPKRSESTSHRLASLQLHFQWSTNAPPWRLAAELLFMLQGANKGALALKTSPKRSFKEIERYARLICVISLYIHIHIYNYTHIHLYTYTYTFLIIIIIVIIIIIIITFMVIIVLPSYCHYYLHSYWWNPSLLTIIYRYHIDWYVIYICIYLYILWCYFKRLQRELLVAWPSPWTPLRHRQERSPCFERVTSNDTGQGWRVEGRWFGMHRLRHGLCNFWWSWLRWDGYKETFCSFCVFCVIPRFFFRCGSPLLLQFPALHAGVFPYPVKRYPVLNCWR